MESAGVKRLFISLMTACVIAIACTNGENAPTPPTDTPAPSPTPLPPAEGGYQAVPALPQANFARMLAFVPIPGSPNEALVATQGGVIHRIALDGSFPPAVFGDVSGLLIPDPGSDEEGLLGVAVSPRFATDGRIFVNYSAGNPRRSVLARFNVVGGVMDPAGRQVVLEVQQPTSINIAGRLAFGPDGYLYWSLGDGGPEGDPNNEGQNLSTLQSSILRLDVSGDTYSVPPDNPFVDVPGAAPQIYAYGLRNAWGFSFDRETGDLWAGDVGDSTWEEVNRVVAGGNYGWSVMEGFGCYAATTCDQAGLIPPRAVYGHDAGCAVIGGYVYRGEAMPELRGWYIYGDYCSGTIWGLNAATNEAPVRLAETGHPVGSFGELPDGELIILSFDRAIYRLERVLD